MRIRKHLGLLLIVIPAIVSTAFVLADAAQQARPPAAPKTLEVPKPKPAERDDAQSQTPQQQPAGEVIGLPMFA